MTPADRKKVEEALTALKQGHLEVDDCWYSCPKADCCNDEKPKDVCTCGADEHNAKIDAILALLHQPVADAWRPIEEAPKDGTWVLLGAPGKETHQAKWVQGTQGGWWNTGSIGEYKNPTHWQPLPQAPKEK